jgi:hypothetical protein
LERDAAGAKPGSMELEAGQACVFCGSESAKLVSIRRHIGMLLVQRFFKLRQPLCRACGMKALREYTLKTLWQGWWGYISFFVNWFVLAANLVAYFQLRGLSQPRPAMATEPVSSERWQSGFANADDRSD